ncbi:hypothetical protein JVT61DRAFT_1941 [Boletus reticuloceps]|uniref:Uncharacterized protein n=1 Tax=Boletus reticuloceps TaxID=495285 RepID=A0A8I2YBW5_9AGAM|nr:hypothetical protein JVT61DRAFT_1941 [Boletus reticuloceps]
MVAHLARTSTTFQSRPHGVHTRQRNPQAAVALSKLCGSEDPSDVEQGEQAAIDVLLDALSCDPAAEVRCAMLLNMPIAKYTLPCILARSCDTDTVMRRLVYSVILEKNCTTLDGSAMGPLHPRVLAISQRELIVRNGLGDREPAVRSVAGSLLGAWVDANRGSIKAEEGDVLAFLGLFDLNENMVAEDALLSIFATHVDIFGQLELKGVYNKYQEDVDTVSQERALRELDADELPGRDLDERLDDILLDVEFVISEMLKLAVNLAMRTKLGEERVHLDLAEDILKTLFKDDMQEEDKKVLGHLHLPDKIRTIKLVHNVFTRRPIRNVSARNALTKFNTMISKKYADKLAEFSEEEY